MAEWKPSLADPGVETLMDQMELPEEDRCEIRRFAEFLRRKAAKKKGEELPPMPQEMKDWLLGKDA